MSEEVLSESNVKSHTVTQILDGRRPTSDTLFPLIWRPCYGYSSALWKLYHSSQTFFLNFLLCHFVQYLINKLLFVCSLSLPHILFSFLLILNISFSKFIVFMFIPSQLLHIACLRCMYFIFSQTQAIVCWCSYQLRDFVRKCRSSL